MTIDSHALLEAEFESHHEGSRTISAAQLAWFLETVWRLDPDQVDEAICDGPGDRGIDGLVVSEDANQIAVLQSRHRDDGKTEGDKGIREFVGVREYFTSAESAAQLRDGLTPNAEVRALIDRTGVIGLLERSEPPEVALIYVTNAPLDDSATDFLGTEPEGLDVWHEERLAQVAARTARPDLLPGEHKLQARAEPIIHDAAGISIALALVPAGELVALPGIADRTIFNLNVRLSVGGTKINRELRSAIAHTSDHPLFPAYHNGLTLLTHGIKTENDVLILDGVSVVNGCQSLIALRDHRDDLTNDLALVTKVVEVGSDLRLGDEITRRSNTQNPVNLRDLRANDRIQRDLQAQVNDIYAGDFFYEIKRGESPPSGDPDRLDNQLAAQLLTAAWLNEPWLAVRKVRLFDKDYHRVFGPGVDAHALRLAFLIDSAIGQHRERLRDDLRASFASVRFTLAYILGRLVRMAPEGEGLFRNPGRWLPAAEADVRVALERLAEVTIDEVNYYVEDRLEAVTSDERPEDEEESAEAAFDPKIAFKSREGVARLERDVRRNATRLFKREPNLPFDVTPP
ncbi:MAG: AIPR family protein [Actinomycetota bacterium]